MSESSSFEQWRMRARDAEIREFDWMITNEGWCLTSESSVAAILFRPEGYDIGLSRMLTRADRYHWIEHLYGKDWGRKYMGDFIRVLFGFFPPHIGDVTRTWCQDRFNEICYLGSYRRGR